MNANMRSLACFVVRTAPMAFTWPSVSSITGLMLSKLPSMRDGGRHAPAAPHIFQGIQRRKEMQPPARGFDRSQRRLQAFFRRFRRGQHLEAESQRERQAINDRDAARKFIRRLLRGADHGSQRAGSMDRDDVLAALIE